MADSCVNQTRVHTHVFSRIIVLSHETWSNIFVVQLMLILTVYDVLWCFYHWYTDMLILWADTSVEPSFHMYEVHWALRFLWILMSHEDSSTPPSFYCYIIVWFLYDCMHAHYILSSPITDFCYSWYHCIWCLMAYFAMIHWHASTELILLHKKVR